jgi:hypothetical protein
VSREGQRLDPIIIHTFRRCAFVAQNDMVCNSCVSPSRSDFPIAMQDNAKLAAQMSCISAKSAQQLHPLDPVALGVVALGDQDGIQQWTHEQAQWHMYHQYYQQQQAFMAQMMATQPPPATGDHATDTSTEAKTGSEESKTNDSAVSGTPALRAPVPPFGPQQMAAMQAFYHQQQQYYAHAMAHQQHLMQSPPGPPMPTATTTTTVAVADGSTERVKGSAEQPSMGQSSATHQVLPLDKATEPDSQPIANNGVAEAAPTTNALLGMVEDAVNNAHASTSGSLHEPSAHSAAGTGLETSNLGPVVEHDTAPVLHPTSNLLPDLSNAVAPGGAEESMDRRTEMAAEDTIYI